MSEQLYRIEMEATTPDLYGVVEFAEGDDDYTVVGRLVEAEASALVMWCFTHALAVVTHEPWRCPEYRPNDECDVGKAAVYRIEEDS